MKLNLLVKIIVVFPSCGCVILTMIAVMIPMNQRTCVVKEIVQLGGNVVPDSQTIVVFLNGCSAMAKMTVGITVMSCQKTVQFVMQKPILNVPITDVFQSM